MLVSFGHISGTYDLFRVHHVNQRIKLPFGTSFGRLSRIFIFGRKFRPKCRKFKIRPFWQETRNLSETSRVCCPWDWLRVCKKSDVFLHTIFSYDHFWKTPFFRHFRPKFEKGRKFSKTLSVQDTLDSGLSNGEKIIKIGPQINGQSTKCKNQGVTFFMFASVYRYITQFNNRFNSGVFRV